MADTGMYTKLVAVIGAAVAVVGVTFSLFNSVLADLMPEVEGSKQVVSMVSLGTVVVLLALTLVIRKRLSVVSQYLWAGCALMLLAGAAFTYFNFSDLARTYVYMYPPGSTGATQRPYVAGPLHEKGRERAGSSDTAAAVSKFGGPHIVNEHQILWTSADRSHVVGSFVRLYALITFLMVSALFVAAIAVWRATDGTGRRIDKPSPV